MKKYFNKQNGVTLTELLVASVVLGIILLGVVSVDIMTRKTHQVSEEGSHVSLKVTALMAHLVNNASQAVGHQGNPGIQVTENILNGANWVLYVRQDGGDPTVYTDDFWLRYLTEPDGDTHFCDDLGVAPPDENLAQCDGAQYIVANIRYDRVPPDDYLQYDLEVNMDPNNLEFYLEINLQSRFDNSEAEDPYNNPEFNLLSRVTFPGHTW